MAALDELVAAGMALHSAEQDYHLPDMQHAWVQASGRGGQVASLPPCYTPTGHACIHTHSRDVHTQTHAQGMHTHSRDMHT